MTRFSRGFEENVIQMTMVEGEENKPEKVRALILFNFPIQSSSFSVTGSFLDPTGNEPVKWVL